MIGHSIPVYRGYSSQYGHGLGNILGGMVRAAIPIVGNLAKKAGASILDKGINYLQNSLGKRTASTAGLEARRQKTKQVKRPASRPRGNKKKKKPPGKPVKRLSLKGKDIFSK